MKKVLFVIALLLLSGCSSSGDVNPFYIKTTDGIKLSANYFPVENSAKGVILLHMLGRAKNDWDDFIPALNKKRFNVLAIDLRGHGMSDSDWKEFTEDDFRKMVLDILAAREYLEDENVNNIGIVGASIGANLALQQAVQDSAIKSVVLLSPGMNYRGIDISESIELYDGPIMIVTSEDDSQSADDSLLLFEAASGKKQFQIFDTAGHGTNMFSEPLLEDIIIEWLTNTV